MRAIQLIPVGFWMACAWSTGCHDRVSSTPAGENDVADVESPTMDASSGGQTATPANGGAPGVATPCPAAAEPELTTRVPGARTLDPAAYLGNREPLLDLDGPDPGFTYNDPHVLEVASEYWMYASATDFFDFPVVLYRLTSTDGVAWARNPQGPIFEPDDAGAWDAGGVETPAVVFFGGQYHLFYTGYPFEVGDPQYDVTDFAIGHATSCDGVRWTRVPGEPVLAPSGTSDGDSGNDWYAFIVGEPGPVVVGGTLYLYFTAVGANAELGTSLEVIGYVTSSDGVNWSEPAVALEPDQALYPRVLDPGPPLDGWVGYSTPNALLLNDEVHLFFDVAYDPDEASWQQVRLHHAVSPAGANDWQQDGAPLASAGDFDFAVAEIRSPAAFVDGNTLSLYFAGHELDGVQPDHFAVGMLTQDLLTR